MYLLFFFSKDHQRSPSPPTRIKEEHQEEETRGDEATLPTGSRSTMLDSKYDGVDGTTHHCHHNNNGPVDGILLHLFFNLISFVIVTSSFHALFLSSFLSYLFNWIQWDTCLKKEKQPISWLCV